MPVYPALSLYDYTITALNGGGLAAFVQ